MTTKEKLLELLEENRNTYLSGEEMAKRLDISRAAIWKGIKSLQNEGCAIDAVTNRGYRMSADTDILSAQGIRKYLRPELTDADISIVPKTASTNDLVREKANAGAPEWSTVLALEQNAGRGRMGRGFFSPAGTGIYMSLLLRPSRWTAEQAVKITTMAAVAVSKAVEAVSGEAAQIKWVNDVFVRGKKICGILTEGAFGLESSMLEYAVLGIGINVYEPEGGFPEEIKDIAGAVLEQHKNGVRNRITAELMNSFFSYYTSPDRSAYVEEYRRRCFVIGQQVKLLSAGGTRDAEVLGVDDECRLLVRYEDGSEGVYSSGEISVRL